MATLNDIIVAVCNRANKDFNNTSVTSRITQSINLECQTAYEGYPWSFRYREFPINLIPDKATALTPTSTATVTTNSPTVTFSDTPLDTVNHVGAFIRFTQDSIQNWYRIQSIQSTSSCTLSSVFPANIPGGTQGTVSGRSYELKKTDYIFPAELSDMASITISYFGLPVTITTATGMSFLAQPPLYRGIPQVASFMDTDFIGTTYTTGTVSGTTNTNTLTGSQTAWLSNVKEGDIITLTGDTTTVGNLTVKTPYVVYKVTSDTAITLYQNLQITSTAVAYTATRQWSKAVRVLPSADNPYTIYIKGLRKYASLINSYDSNDLLIRYPDAVIEGVVRRELASSPDRRELGTLSVSDSLWRRAKAADAALSHTLNTSPAFNFRAGGTRIL